MTWRDVTWCSLQACSTPVLDTRHQTVRIIIGLRNLRSLAQDRTGPSQAYFTRKCHLQLTAMIKGCKLYILVETNWRSDLVIVMFCSATFFVVIKLNKLSQMIFTSDCYHCVVVLLWYLKATKCDNIYLVSCVARYLQTMAPQQTGPPYAIKNQRGASKIPLVGGFGCPSWFFMA